MERHRLQKGEFGYYEHRRSLAILFALLLLVCTILMFLIPYRILGTRKNIFSIMAALMCLPTAKFVVDMIMYLRGHGCSEQAFEEIEGHIGNLTSSYDLYLTSYQKNFQISHVTIAGKSVCGLTEDPKCDTKAAENHILSMMKQNGLRGYNVKIFTNLNSYLTRLDQMNDLAGEEGAEDADRFHALMHAISL